MAVKIGRRAASAIALMSVVASSLVLAAGPASADPGGMVISELNYHAGSDLDADDFVELTNTSGTAIDMSGWSFSAGVTGTFAAGTVVPAHGYFVVAKDAAQFQTTYGFTPNALYGGNLSNSGEAVTLVDANLAVVDTVTYSDSPPWPTSPDGTGPSLELKGIGLDNTVPDNWGPSLATGGTPGAKNSIDGTGPAPVVTGLTATPARPAPGQAVAVSAKLTAGSTAQLTYKILFGADVTVPFLDDAASVGGANDGVYSGTIPAQTAGTLIRYRVDASSGGVAYSEPAAGDSVRYRGVVVTNPAVSTQLPVIEWFMDDAVYNDILANHRLDSYQGDAVWSYNGQVTDGALMSVRGNSSRTNAKVSWKVELPKGYTFDLGGQLPYPLDEFALQNYSDNFADVSWATVKAGGDRALNIVPVRTQRNGAFWSLGRIMETEDGSWRDNQGVSDWSIYKGDGGSVGRTASPAALAASGWLDKKSPKKDTDFTDAWTLSNTVDAAPSAAQQAWIYQNVNIPELVNYMAINSIIRHQDSGWYNWWLANDTNGTGRWGMWQWDLNWTFTTAASDGKGLFLTPDTSNHFTQAMLAYPEIKDMFYRRLRTLADQFLSPGQFEAQWDAISAKTTPDWNLDHTKWGGYTPASARSSFAAGLADRRNAINGNTGAGKPVPVSQAADASVVINEIQYHPAGTGGEYIELANQGTTAVDISGWTIDAIGLTIQPGTVIPAGGRAVFVSNDKAFRQAYTGANRFVAGQFTGTLDDTGEAVVLRAGSRTVDSVTYSNQAPWPTAADGTGPSLELNSVTADNSVAANWSARSTTGGTPGLANTTGAPANAAPVAAFTSSVSGLAVSVNGSSSTDSDGTVASYAWDFGDGASATGPTASHTYATAGTYTVMLTVKDNGGASGAVTHTVTVAAAPPGNAAPVAAFTSSVSALAVSVNGSSSTDSDGTVASYAWGFGDGATATGATTSHTYAAAGTYTVTLTVTDNGGATGTVTHAVTVASAPSGTAMAEDAFNRTVANGLGTADTGGAWTVSGTASNFSVANGAAAIASPAGANRYAYLNSVSAADTEVRATIGFDRPTASSIYTGLIGRRVGTATYGASVVVGTTGAVKLQLQRNTDTLLKSATVSGLTLNTGDKLLFRLQVTGTSPTTIQAKVWKVGSTEPAAWQLTTTDATAGLQSAGSIGLYSYLSTTGKPAPLTVSFDDLWAGPTGSTPVPPVNAAPVAAFTSSVSGLAVSVNGSSSTDSDGTVASYAWDFGDGASATGPTASHTYATAGTYTVMLTVKDNGGASGAVTHTVTVAAAPPGNAAPVAAFTSSVSALAVSVNGSSSTDSDGTVASYAWGFGDGATATGATTSHTYAAAGTYTVTLTVTDNGGATGTVTHAVTVASAPSGTAMAEDAFNRTVANGLGTADTGGAWTVSGTASNFSVANGAAAIASPAGANRYAYLNSVSAADTEVRATIGFDRPTASSIYTGLIGRRVGTATYGASVVVGTTGAVKLQLQRNTDTLLKSATVSGLTLNTGDKLLFRLQVTGTSPTTIQAKVWKVGSTEPAAWQLTTTDATAGLQSAGSIGLYSYLSTTGKPAPLTVSFDDLWAGPTA